MFAHVIDALVHGPATSGSPRRLLGPHDPPPAEDLGALGIGEQVHALALAAYDQMIGLQLDDLAADGCHTKAPCGGERAGPSPVDRRKGGLKRSLATEAPASRWGSPPPARTGTTPRCWPRPSGRRQASSAAPARPTAPATSTPATTASPPASPRRPRLRRRDRPQGRARPHPGGHAGWWNAPTPG